MAKSRDREHRPLVPRGWETTKAIDEAKDESQSVYRRPASRAVYRPTRKVEERQKAAITLPRVGILDKADDD